MSSEGYQLSPSDPAVKTKFANFKSEITKEATHILAERMPQKILYFNKLVSEKPQTDADGKVSDDAARENPWLAFIPNTVRIPESLSEADCIENVPVLDGTKGDSSRGDRKTEYPAAKRMKVVRNGKDITVYPSEFPANLQIYKMTEEIKKEVAELIEMAGAVKLFIQLNVPRIEGGNNFGVQIQEEAIQELARVEDAAFSVCTAIVEYFTSRANLATKIVKYPNVQDYKEALRELDEKKWMLLKVTRIDIRNNYAMLYDLLSKNWERVVKPRHTEATSMMY